MRELPRALSHLNVTRTIKLKKVINDMNVGSRSMSVINVHVIILAHRGMLADWIKKY